MTAFIYIFLRKGFFSISCYCLTEMMPWICSVQVVLHHCSMLCCAGDGPRAHLQKLAECIRWSYGAGIVLRLGNIARLELNYCVPMGVQSGDRWGSGAIWLLHFTGFRVFYRCNMANWLAAFEFSKRRRTVQSQVMMVLLYQMENAETTSVNGTNWDYFLPNVVT